MSLKLDDLERANWKLKECLSVQCSPNMACMFAFVILQNRGAKSILSLMMLNIRPPDLYDCWKQSGSCWLSPLSVSKVIMQTKSTNNDRTTSIFSWTFHKLPIKWFIWLSLHSTPWVIPNKSTFHFVEFHYMAAVRYCPVHFWIISYMCVSFYVPLWIIGFFKVPGCKTYIACRSLLYIN